MLGNKSNFENLNISKYICVFYKNFQKYCEDKLKPYNLTNGLYSYLIFVYKKPGCNLNEISNFLDFDKAHTTRAIQKLIDYDYVKKIVNKNDNRAFNIYPTEKCNEVMEKMINLFDEWEAVVIKDFSQEEYETIKRLFKKAFTNIY